MKSIKIIIAIVILITNKSYATVDSNSIFTDTIYGLSSDSILVTNQDVFSRNNHEIQLKNKVSSKVTKNLNNITKPANWFSDAWEAFTDLFKPVWGYYEEDGQRQEGPYFLFDRSLDGPTYVQIQNIIKTFIN